MKKIIVLTALVAISWVGRSQPLSAPELLDMVKCRTNACVEGKLGPKSYEAGLNNQTEDFSLWEYFSRTSIPFDDNPNVVLPNKLEYSHTGAGYIIGVNYLTGSRHEYEILLLDFKKEGFLIDQDTYTTFDNVQTEYMSAKYPATRLQVTEFKRHNNEQHYTEYGFKLKWMPEPNRDEIAAHRAMFGY